MTPTLIAAQEGHSEGKFVTKIVLFFVRPSDKPQNLFKIFSKNFQKYYQSQTTCRLLYFILALMICIQRGGKPNLYNAIGQTALHLGRLLSL